MHAKTLGTHHQVTAATLQALQEAALEGPASPIGTYSCNLHILDPVGDAPQVTYMTADHWHQAQRADPVLSLMIVRMQDRTLGQSHFKPTSPLQLWQFLQVEVGFLYRKILPNESQEAQLQLVLPTAHSETTLKGCHDKICHVGLKQILNLMHNHFFCP